MSDFEMDDSFLLEALEDVEKTEVLNTLVLSTPPDSEICSNFNSIGPNICQDYSAIPGSGVASESNFRSQLMKSLLHTRNNSSKLRSTLNLEHSLREDIFTPQKSKRKFCENNNESDFHRSIVDSTISSKCASLSAEPQYIHKNLRNEACIKDHPTNPGFRITPNSNVSSPISINPNTSTVRKRKFPGPAGLLPKWEHRITMKLNLPEDESSKIENNSTEDTVCSQTTAQEFASGPWNQMLIDLSQWENLSKQLIQNNNVRWILRRASLRGQAFMRKIVFLVVMVKSMDPSYTDATAVFQDETGEIHGTVSQGVLEKYPDSVLTGTVFVLKDVTLLSPASIQPGMGQLKRHYLTITLNAVVSLYSSDEAGAVTKIEVAKVTAELLSSFLCANEGNQERRRVIENEDKEEMEQVSLFETCNPRREEVPKTLPHQQSFPKYKNPVASTRPILHPKNPVVNKINSGRAWPSPSAAADPKTSFPRQQSESFPPPLRDAKEQTLSESARRLKCTAAALQSFSDDDEFDTILASINTDSL